MRRSEEASVLKRGEGAQMWVRGMVGCGRYVREKISEFIGIVLN